MNIIETYNKTGRVPCLKCGLDLVQRECADTFCSETECKGVIITKEILVKMSKEQGIPLLIKEIKK